MKKIIITVFAASSLLLYSTPSFALLNFSVGVPLSHTFTGKWSGGTAIESEGVSGYFIQIGVPMLPGLGMDSYETKLKCEGCDEVPKISTTMYNLYYLLPIPIVNLTIGVGTGKIQHSYGGVAGDDGAATQWYTSFGMPIIPLFDLHLSYRSISSKLVSTSAEYDLGGNIMGLGIGFNF